MFLISDGNNKTFTLAFSVAQCESFVRMTNAWSGEKTYCVYTVTAPPSLTAPSSCCRRLQLEGRYSEVAAPVWAPAAADHEDLLGLVRPFSKHGAGPSSMV